MRKIKTGLAILCISIISILVGGGFAFYSIKQSSSYSDFMLYNGPWRVNPNMDLKNPKQRALIAIVGLFALRESEVVYFTATIDSDGNPLSSDHDYVLEGSIPNARYWSYTLYGQDDFLIPNPDKIYGYNAESITYKDPDTDNPEMKNVSQSTYKMHLSKEKTGNNWLPSGDNEALALTLRLYNAAPEVYNNLATIPLPDIKRIR